MVLYVCIFIPLVFKINSKRAFMSDIFMEELVLEDIQLPAAFPPPCPEQIPQDPFWVPWAPAGLPFRSPWAPPWTLFGGLGHLLVSPWTPFGTKTKKDTKSDLVTPRFGVQVGTQNRHFSGKSGNEHETIGSQTGSGKRVLS